ncbi:MAG: crossover junction endodeoxyribonuclease RuvC [Candidatus Latescibacteria bacterium]|nr:crossover junction endodeoxyribonuclease RuvC [bacterium]MBD3423948.1 crossover junction endodeoxyribonuclease RuvC [Candidatus Latescibacterota bacterium]
MPLTLGIDPGSYRTGYGLARSEGSRNLYVDSGVIMIPRNRSRAERLMQIKDGIDAVISEHHPDDIAIEGIFVSKNPRSAFALGEARGVILLAAAEAGKNIFEYSPREVKRTVAGSGNAPKSQVAGMIEKLLNLTHQPETSDETDALAIAFCHLVRCSSKLRGLV